LGSLSVGLNPSEFTSPCSKRARLEESGSPEPFVHSHSGHNPILVSGGMPEAGRLGGTDPANLLHPFGLNRGMAFSINFGMLFH
jgi:hypothetical protein